MEEKTYTVHELAKLSGLTVRALHYYDEKGLLLPQRSDNGYRKYGKKEVDRLQHILLYREFGMELEKIKDMLDSDSFDRKQALLAHRNQLAQQKKHLEVLIKNVDKTLKSIEGGEKMNDTEKFEGFKQKLVEDNEHAYGTEIRHQYGTEVVDASNERVKGMTQSQWERTQELGEEIQTTLAQAVLQGDPAGDIAQKVCELHREWICMHWPEGKYSKEAHRSLGDMYVADDRFKKYYEDAAPGAAEFLKQALDLYCR